jgi:hypothetical protein
LVVFADRVDDDDYQRCASMLSMGLMGLIYTTRMEVDSIMNFKFTASNFPTSLDLRIVHALYDDKVRVGSTAAEFSRALAGRQAQHKRFKSITMLR